VGTVSSPIVRLQVQVEPLKQGEKPHRWYDPAHIRQVGRLSVDDNGASGFVDDVRVLDAHHLAHPRSRNHGRASGLSIGFTAHYRTMREQFGEHVTDGVAGENVLVDSSHHVTVDHLEDAALRTRDGHTVRFDEVKVAEPCVEFSRFALGVAPGEIGSGMREPLQQLRGGMRGFYVALAEPIELRVGDELVLEP
jgi:hypothetical protein